MSKEERNLPSDSVTSSNGTAAASGAPARLVVVAEFEHQVTGVTVTPSNRIIVNFPRWSEDAPLSVAELRPDGSLRPFPNAEWNAWRNAKKDEMTPHDHWVCVQSVVADARGNVWVLDPAAPAQDRVVPGGPKLVKIDPQDRVLQTIAFDESIAPQGSYLNDVRFSADGQHAFLTESGARGALVVVDLASGKSRRVLDGHPSTQPEKDVQIQVEGKVLRRTDGRGVEFSADGIALSADGRWLYWQAIKGRTLYRVPTEALRDDSLPPEQLESQVEKVGENGPADGLWIDAADRMYVSAVQENAVKVREGQQLRMLVQDARLRWPDTFSQGPDGTMYVTASHIPDMNWFDAAKPLAVKTTLFRIEQ
ncbi:L-dopachrome tautomerase-related protein [Ramlibacter sp.]|uniref:SMP-30/gluconolactonase/LRE family protein n=1 Tax=Ramlibacter sp. TaxID=1917967 RepID=UPI002614EBC5|nr:L-dopachrome tautomerase-related protein [Ramlibacter sp.]MDB5956834.1 hypothetical protein [Ramlibacter sp.]